MTIKDQEQTDKIITLLSGKSDLILADKIEALRIEGEHSTLPDVIMIPLRLDRVPLCLGRWGDAWVRGGVSMTTINQTTQLIVDLLSKDGYTNIGGDFAIFAHQDGLCLRIK